MKRGRKWQATSGSVERRRAYSPQEAVQLVKKSAYTRFDATVSVAVKVGYKSLQNVRGVLHLPHGSGREVRVAVFARENHHEEARKVGAEHVGGLDLIEKVQKENWTDFDACVATPDMMKEMGRVGAILGRKGLMPKPRSGTVTTDVATAVKSLKSGQLEYRPDKTGVVHLRAGKVSFEDSKLEENIRSIYQALVRDKPADAKGEYIRSFFISPTMGQAVRVSTRMLAS